MKVADIMKILQDDIGVAVIATADESGQPHGRFINIGVANDQGVLFMTSPETNFYQQLMANPKIAITGLNKDDYLIQTIRIEGQVKAIGRDRLKEVIGDNPYIDYVYPEEDAIASVQVFHMYEGQGFYHSLTQGHKYHFDFKASE
ncbi:ABC transporter ATP-binding protein [Aerococcus urinaehominis]|uniref:ABC transporter ATP-binding protein n=1 Tax=Aerococcus urinaehominis TaxID=128944 RepID=A0A109RGW5_9LACT|nr:pyridoxamine 5'-phosphate oxidase family protein [Aerococcus urinaehominis]AMB99111.1 ABC transporter ATP-binding protein [Aerococcus urinaehominis]SDM04052.1 Uncharacterized protein, pyridoxamine 5'-phosphate oxidase (PNPOx-like) family [Aerococcus urinaehominis]